MPTNKNEKSAKFDKNDIKVSSLILFVMGALFLFILMIDREVLSSFNFIFDTDFVSDSQASHGIFVLAVSWSKIVITVYLVSFFADRYYKNSNPLYLSFSLLIVLISISIFNGTSRNEVLIEAVAYTYLLVLLYPRFRKAIYIICMGALGLIILFITISRYFETRNISEGISNYTLENNVATLNSYFAGQQNIAVGVKSLALYWQDYQIHTIFKDFFANAIYFNQYVTNIRGTVDIFNLTLYGHSNWADQISPTITQAIGLFGLLGIFIPVLISFFIIKMDILTKNKFNVFGVFLTSYISVNIAFYSPGNITILFTALTNRFIPLFLIYLLANVYFIKKEKIRKPS